MGLDMYLHKKVYIGANYEHRNVKGIVDISIKEKKIEIPFNEISEISLTKAYWRKANQIHAWFVENVQDDVDDCRGYEVSGKQLLQLVDICKEVLKDKSKASELLPVSEGFFFGGNEYDEYYFSDVQDTIDQLKDIDKDSYYSYHSSW
jgi:hypothetical protein